MDVVEDAARERAEQAEADYFTTDLDRILSDDGIDAVLICSTHDTHADLAVQALEAGKQVFCEKPLAMTMEEARRIQEAVHRTGIPLMSGWWFKHSPVTKRLREVIREPRFVLFTCRIPPGPYTSPDPYGKGGLLDTAGYNIHWTWHVMRSQPVEVSAVGMDGQATSTSTINVRFENGGDRHVHIQRPGQRRHPAQALRGGPRRRDERGHPALREPGVRRHRRAGD